MRILFRKSLYILGILVILLGLTPMLTVQAAPHIINTDTTWSGTIYLDRDVIVMATAKLTIEPGTQVIINSSDNWNIGIDNELVEIIIDGELEAVGTEFYYFGANGRWYGIRVNGNTEIRECVFKNAIRAIHIKDYSFTKKFIIEGNEITNGIGKHGILGSIDGKTAVGIFVESGKPVITNNHIHDIKGGAGLADASGLQAGAGGHAGGISLYEDSSQTVIVDNLIENVTGGLGGVGYDGIAGSGEPGSAGGAGGQAYGIQVGGDYTHKISITGNLIRNILGGNGGRGGNGGSGGTNSNGGTGGVGGNSGRAVGLAVTRVNDLEITGNYIKDIQAGMHPGVGGNGGVGNGTGNGGHGNSGGSGGMAVGFWLNIEATFQSESGGFNANHIYNISSANGRSGGWGGAGGSSGNGGQGGTGGFSSEAYGIRFSCMTACNPGPIVNNVVANVDAKRGGDGGAGGTGGSGGHGGHGGNTGLASLLYLVNIENLTVTNNTLYGAVSSSLASEGGSPGGVGAIPGNPGLRSITAGIYALNGNYYVYNNIIAQMNTPPAHGYVIPDGIGIMQATGGKVIADYNGFNNWIDNFSNVDSEGHSVNRPPEFIDAGNLNFRLDSGSDMIDAGNGTLPMTPSLDIVGRARPFEDHVDLGAYEFYFVNQPPFFTSDPINVAIAGESYSYQVQARDPNEGPHEQLMLFATTLPSWLTLIDHGDGRATLSGQPSLAHLGNNPVWLVVKDWDGATGEQRFTITVTEPGGDQHNIFLPLIVR